MILALSTEQGEFWSAGLWWLLPCCSDVDNVLLPGSPYISFVLFRLFRAQSMALL